VVGTVACCGVGTAEAAAIAASRSAAHSSQPSPPHQSQFTCTETTGLVVDEGDAAAEAAAIAA